MSARESPVGEYPQIFVKSDGRPVKFLLLDTVDKWDISDEQVPLSAGRTRALTKKIRLHGGVVIEERKRKEADTVIVNEAAQEDYRDYYKLNRTTYAEHPGFIERCISNGKYQHQIIAQRGMGGRPIGSTRNNFTPDDERHMAEFVALTIPYPENGGRLGPGLWAWLLNDFSTRPEYAWTKRHTVQSWQEHYKKNREHLDEMVAAIVAENPPPADGKCSYPYSRKRTRRNLRLEVIDMDDDEIEEVQPAKEPDVDEGEEEAEEEAVVELLTPRKRRRVDVTMDGSEEGDDDERQSARDPSIALREEEEESSSEEPVITWPEDIFEGCEPPPEDDRPGPADAGPSGTLRTPSPPARRQAQQQRRRVQPQTSMPPPRPKPRPRAIPPPPTQDADTGIPMSSQATLVAPTQPQVAQKRATQPSPARRGPVPARREAVSVESSPQGQVGRGQRASPVARRERGPASVSPSKRRLVAEVVVPRNRPRSGRRDQQVVETNVDVSVEAEIELVDDEDKGDEDGELEVVIKDGDGNEVVVVNDEDEVVVVDDEDEVVVVDDEDEGEEKEEENEEEDEIVEDDDEAVGDGSLDLQEVELLSSDDERTRQSIRLSHGRSASKRKFVPGAFPRSPSLRTPLNTSGHHDFSASEDEDADNHSHNGTSQLGSSRETHAPSPPSSISRRTAPSNPVTPAVPGRRRQQILGVRSVPASALRGQKAVRTRADKAEARSEGRSVDNESERSSPIRSPPVTRTYSSKRSVGRT